ncbi:hypothetical protein N0V93_002685 [Gnomoniopsis smithogilvyi]|uniref:cutinase n=1 Tax=Gnomoniopsis smithogilvyi TaxID=1191159 RepID=A0A9W8YX58_9PEZI|nr:hypothetical protein N0V93_002685 [Gnomoniopsis smithogilvyi]
MTTSSVTNKIMKTFLFLAALYAVGPVVATPLSTLWSPSVPDSNLLRRQTTPETSNEFTDGGCRDVILFFARGTGAPGNMGLQPGRQLSDVLKQALGDSMVATQGVPYSAATAGNFYPGGSYPNDTAVYVDLINDAASDCPSSKIVVTGYSQGAALVVNAIHSLNTTVRSRIAAAVCFGDTQQHQDGDVIPNFATDKTALYCNTGDVICEDGILLVTTAHSNYTNYVPDASNFIQSKL